MFARAIALAPLCFTACVDPGIVPGADQGLPGAPIGSLDGLTVIGPVIGEGAPAEARSVVLWRARGGEPHELGGGTVRGGLFLVDVIGPPPVAVTSADGIAVGTVVVVGVDAGPSDGALARGSLRVLGVSRDHALIWKQAGAGPVWSQRFPTGYACGRAVRPGDGFEPVACREVVVVAAEGGVTVCDRREPPLVVRAGCPPHGRAGEPSRLR